jgi:dTDP-L-rhamnose 4-epimerase
MRIVITGGAGFIGIELARKLLAADHEVLLVDSLSTQIHGDVPTVEVPLGAKVVRVDICDLTSRHELLEGSDAVVHLAAETGTAQSMYQAAHYTRVNCSGTAALLEAIAKCTRRPKQVLLASSRSVYGEGAYTLAASPGTLVTPRARTREDCDARRWELVDTLGRPIIAVPTPESLALSPGSVYAATKAAQELLLASASVALGFRLTVLRFQNVYGEGQSLRNPYTGIISIFFNRARQGLAIPLFEDGLESRDFIHVSDVVSALAASLCRDLPNNITLNIGSGVPTTVSQLASALLVASKLDVPVVVTGQYRLGDIRHCFADLTRAAKYLDFSPKITLKNGLKRFCDWAARQPVYSDRSSQAEAELRNRGLAS